MKKPLIVLSILILGCLGIGIASSAKNPFKVAAEQTERRENGIVTIKDLISTHSRNLGDAQRRDFADRSQNAIDSVGDVSRPVPDHIMMDELVYHFRFLKQRAENVARQGRDSRGLTEFYKRRMNLSEAENAGLRNTLSVAEVEVQNIDNQIRAVTQNYRDRVRSGVRAGVRPPEGVNYFV